MPLTLEQRYIRMRARADAFRAEQHAEFVRRYGKRLQKLKDELIKPGKCAHTETETYRWEHDNGYGKQTMITGKICVHCRARNPWGAHSQNWITEKDYNKPRRDDY